jgi:DNA polymerase III epsilon subunit-like protein
MAAATSSLSISPDGTVDYQLEPSAASHSIAPVFLDNWTLVDTETDGLWEPISVIEIAAQRFQGLRPVGEPFKVFINHGIEIPEAATAIHGYTTDFIKDNGLDPKVAYSAFREYVGETYVAAHYLIFDWDRVLVPELVRLGEPAIGKRGFCTWFLSRRSLPEFRTHRLDYLREVFTLKCSRAHSASGDVEAVADLLSRVVFPRLGRAGMSDIASIAEFSRLTPLSLCRNRFADVEIGLPYKDIPYLPSPLPAWKQAARERRGREAEQERLRELAENVLRGSTSYPQLLLEYRMLEETPDVLFRDETFVFTGTMTWGSRSKAEKEIVQPGGVLFKTKAMKDIDYLVLGEHPETGWLSRDSGPKLASAFVYNSSIPAVDSR